MNRYDSLIANLRGYSRRVARGVAVGASDTARLPYPVSVHRRIVEREGIPVGGGTENFDQPGAAELNHARLAHLASLSLPLGQKRVLDVGCGVGHLAQFFVAQGCEVLCLDGRPENIASLRSRYPDLHADVADVETDALSRFGAFDIVFCYGLLYHLENPVVGLRNMASVCKELLLLETIICDHSLPVLRLDDETAAFSQALRGLGCRPSPSYVVTALNRVGFPFIYAPKVAPDHEDFRFEWKSDLSWRRDGHPLRSVFIASRKDVRNRSLVSLLSDP